ncbi:MAG TPA: hypothetical protein PLP03_07340, partial [Bacteroidales bacterium]|nr:hypothetical protein [Bacteroidales bacterium]
YISDSYGFEGQKTAQNRKKKETFSSFGVELLADFYVLRIPYMISAGIQASWQKGNSSPTIGWLFNIDIYGMNIGRYRQ